MAPLDDAGSSIERAEQSLPIYLNSIHYIFLMMMIMQRVSGISFIFFIFILLDCLSRVYNPVGDLLWYVDRMARAAKFN